MTKKEQQILEMASYNEWLEKFKAISQEQANEEIKTMKPVAITKALIVAYLKAYIQGDMLEAYKRKIKDAKEKTEIRYTGETKITRSGKEKRIVERKVKSDNSKTPYTFQSLRKDFLNDFDLKKEKTVVAQYDCYDEL